jgi:hypothetical protein
MLLTVYTLSSLLKFSCKFIFILQIPAEFYASVTVYFSDIVGFTEIAAISTPLEVDIQQNLFFNTRMYWGADKSLARPTSRCILFDGENVSFDASLVMYI